MKNMDRHPNVESAKDFAAALRDSSISRRKITPDLLRFKRELVGLKYYPNNVAFGRNSSPSWRTPTKLRTIQKIVEFGCLIMSKKSVYER